MKKRVLSIMVGILLLLPASGFCGGDLDVFISNLNAEARVDLGAFKARVATTFGVPMVQVEAVIGDVRTPGDAYMVFRAGRWPVAPTASCSKSTGPTRGRVGGDREEPRHQARSAEFHALKKGWATEGRATARAREKGARGKSGKKDKGKGRRIGAVFPPPETSRRAGT